ncbi:MAG: hypothetical protein KF849_18925 [Rhizobiaceae bacterium]|nr:hypothetical protein [Rhizobiaceae bacterium]
MNWNEPETAVIEISGQHLSGLSLASVLRTRRSRRTLSEAPLEDVAFVVRETLRTDFLGADHNSGRKRKAVVSAGALHPIKGVLIGREPRPLVYDDDGDRFISVEVRDRRQFDEFREACRAVVPTANGHWVALVADTRELERLYMHCDSLLWRDAGAVIQTMAFIAEAAGLAFCPLGILGHQLLRALLPSDPALVALGVVAIGRSEADQKAS